MSTLDTLCRVYLFRCISYVIEAHCRVYFKDPLSCISILEIRFHVYSEAPIYVYFLEPLSCLFYRRVVMSILQARCRVYFTGALSCIFYRRVVVSILQTRCHVCSRDPLPFLFQRPVDTCCVAASRKRRTRSP